jgi:hypothetical protein
MTVYLAHEPRGPGIDLRPLYDFAKSEGHDVRFVFSKAYNVGQHAPESLAVAETFAANFDFAKDFLVLAGGDPLASMFCSIALTHEAIAAGAKSFRSLRFIRDRDAAGNRTVAKYLPVTIPTGV